MAPKISVVIPCYNARGKVDRCLRSLERIDLPQEQYEVLFVDDCSTDGTYERLVTEADRAAHWRVLRLEVNSGSPSRPRNRGIDAARGAYVFFLDCDDEILPDTLRVHLAHAERTGADLVRGHLLADDGAAQKVMNRISGWRADFAPRAKIARIIGGQSTTVPSLIRTELLRQHGIRWPEEIRMGEDTLFLIDVLSVAGGIEYIDHPTFVYHKAPTWPPSSTQLYGERELRNHLIVWREAERKLAAVNISYQEIRLRAGFLYALKQLLWRNRGDITDETYAELSGFIREHWRVLRAAKCSARQRELLAVLKAGDIAEIRRSLRLRLVISGYDLKFARPLIPILEERFEVRVDEWSGHARHDAKQSKSLSLWAEVIWCEWLLQNAVWWSERKRQDQVLVVRAHRFELQRDFGHRVQVDAVDCFFSVSLYWFERLIETFGIDRRKVRLIPNVLEAGRFDARFHAERPKNLALIGFAASLKGLRRALELLLMLRQVDRDVRLHLFGQKPEDVPWIAKDPQEMAYFEECRRFAVEHDLESALRYHGHVDIPEALARHQIGFVLSASTVESFHFAPAEGFAGGGIGVLVDWDGVEFVYPKRFICSTLDEARDLILAHQDEATFVAASRAGRDFVTERHGPRRFLQAVTGVVQEFSP